MLKGTYLEKYENEKKKVHIARALTPLCIAFPFYIKSYVDVVLNIGIVLLLMAVVESAAAGLLVGLVLCTIVDLMTAKTKVIKYNSSLWQDIHREQRNNTKE